MVERLLIGLLTGGHVLLEGVPGSPRRSPSARWRRRSHTKFQRIQFTPDLLPADVVGTQIYDQRTGQFTVKQGPIFANLVLADEINRAPAKVQAALLEAMQEQQVTIGGTTYPLDEPFLVLATQNPIEQEGTYPLPEAQVDRFMLKLRVGYPTRDEEKEIMRRMAGGARDRRRSASPPRRRSSRLARRIAELYVDDGSSTTSSTSCRDARAGRVRARRPAPLIEFGASPRATIALAQAARAHAFLRGRGFVTPEDVKAIGARRPAPPRADHLRGRGRGGDRATRSSRRVLDAIVVRSRAHVPSSRDRGRA